MVGTVAWRFWILDSKEVTAWLSFDSREAKEAEKEFEGGETISRMMVSLILMMGVGSGVGVGVGRTISGSGRGTGNGTGSGVGEGFTGEIFKGYGSSLGILILPFSVKPLIRLKLSDLVMTENKLAKLKSNFTA